MDRLYRRQRHVYDATRKYYLLGRDRLIRRLDPPAGSRVLEIGCGTGPQPDRRRTHLSATCTSSASTSPSEMLGTARRLVEREGLGSDIRLARADATAFDPALLFGVPGFSRIFISYSLSMMPGWQAVLAARWPGWRRAASCMSSISAARSGCPAGSGSACAQWLRLLPCHAP